MTPDKVYLAPHLRKDVPTCNAVVIALSAILSAVCGSTVAILSAQLSHYRKEPAIGGYWMAGLLFVSPGLTGMTVAYKRRVMTITSHLGVTVVATVLGGVASVYAFMTIYTDTCTPYPMTGECHKVPLMILCVTSLVLAAILCVISLITTIYTYNRILSKQAEVAAQQMVDDRVEAAANRVKRRVESAHKAQENIAMDVNSPDKVTGAKTEGEFSSYL